MTRSRQARACRSGCAGPTAQVTTENTKTEELLYNMVQESKKLLHEWTRTSYLNKKQKLDLRRRTRIFLRMSSTFTLMNGKLAFMGPIPNKPKDLFNLLNQLDPARFTSYHKFLGYFTISREASKQLVGRDE